MSWLSFEDVGRGIVVPIIVGVITGLGGSWITVNTQIAELEAKARQNTQSITRLRTQQEGQSQQASENSERLVRLETKVDLLLRNEGIKSNSLNNHP